MRILALLAVASLLLAHGALAQQAPPTLLLDGYYEVEEGDQGITMARLPFRIHPVAPGEVSFTISTEAFVPLDAVPGQDYQPLAGHRVVVPAGQSEGVMELPIIGDTEVEGYERFLIRLANFSGAQVGDGSVASVTQVVEIANDDHPPAPALVGNDDYVSFRINYSSVYIWPGDNDVAGDPADLRDSVMTLVEEPRHGTLEQVDTGEGIDLFIYSAQPDFAGRDQFTYRLCTADGGDCIVATVYLRGQLDDPILGWMGGRAGGLEWEFLYLPPLENVRYLASSLAHGREIALVTSVDDTPFLAWDSDHGNAWTTGRFPASGAGDTVEHRVLVRLRESGRQKVDLRIGLDRNRDGRPSADEEVCLASAIQDEYTVCDALVPVAGEPVDYWVAVHSREPAVLRPVLTVFTMRMDDPGSLLRVTGPVRKPAEAALRVQMSYVDPPAIGPLAAYVRVMDGDTLLGEYRWEGAGGEAHYLLPVDGTEVEVGLQPNSVALIEDRGLFFDVPLGASSITLTGQADQPVSVALYWAGSGRNREPHVGLSGLRPPAPTFTTIPAGGTRTVRVDAPREGRWFALARNEVDRIARLKIRVGLEANLPTLRPGSYFNTEQPGHGLLMYPAGDQWAGLWYTYDGRALPTWYYLQGARPGPGGIWRAPIYRHAWDGAAARKTQVGEMQLTPLDSQRFIMSYMVDGRAGSQIMDALGSGCPAWNGQPLDISSHWFDPARSGNGYSVQTWEDGYQFIAAFTYDLTGYPLFLAAERSDLGGGVADLPMELLTGPCPTCDYFAPYRRPAGVLRRILGGGTLARIEMDIDFSRDWPLPGRQTFSVADQVQLLGGPGTTQGCAP